MFSDIFWQTVSTCSHVPRWLQDANSPALSGKVGVKRAASVGGQQFAKVALMFDHNSKIFFEVCPRPVQEESLILMLSGGQDRSVKSQLREPRKLLSCFCRENLEKLLYLKTPRNYFGSAIEKPGILFVPTTSKPAHHRSEILYDKCFFEYITITFVTFWC